MSILATLFYFFLALFLLVIIHEFGHFLVARLCGVKVLRFSFGFGPILACWHDKKGTEYAFSLVPLGGYVKMLDEDESPVPVAEKHLAFNNKSTLVRMAIAAAGPLFNFLFAFIALWLVLVVGIKSLAPIVDSVQTGSLADKAGLQSKQEIIKLGGYPIASWHDFQYRLMPFIGTDQTIPVVVKSLDSAQLKKLSLNLSGWQLEGRNATLWSSLGIIPFIPQVPPVVGKILENSPASQYGFQVNDRILFVDKKPIKDWFDLLEIVKQNPNKLMSFTIERHQHTMTFPVKLSSVRNDGHNVGQLGLQSQRVNWPKNWLRYQRQAPFEAIGTAFYQTVDLTKATFVLIGRLATGKVSLRGISGPVGIAQGAGESAQGGFSYYMFFLALISISLGVLNLMPIPLLDGGHLLYYVIELIRRRPLSTEFKTAGIYIGFVLLMTLMVVALTNDLEHLASKF